MAPVDAWDEPTLPAQLVDALPPANEPLRRPPVTDRPVLVVNWTAVTGGAVTRSALMDDRVDHAAWDAVRQSILDDFSVQSELLFESRAAIHSTERRAEDDLLKLRAIAPGDDHFGVLPYPSEIADGVVDVDEAWAELQRPSRFVVGTQPRPHPSRERVRPPAPPAPVRYAALTAPVTGECTRCPPPPSRVLA